MRGYHSQGHETLAKHLMSFDNEEEAAAVAKTGEKEGEDVISGQPHLIEVHSKGQDDSQNITLGYYIKNIKNLLPLYFVLNPLF